jgi:hypothetical protein
MKKFILIAAVAFAFTACHSGASTEATAVDSTVVKADTAKVDSTVKVITVVDSAKKAK